MFAGCKNLIVYLFLSTILLQFYCIYFPYIMFLTIKVNISPIFSPYILPLNCPCMLGPANTAIFKDVIFEWFYSMTFHLSLRIKGLLFDHLHMLFPSIFTFSVYLVDALRTDQSCDFKGKIGSLMFFTSNTSTISKRRYNIYTALNGSKNVHNGGKIKKSELF